VLAAEVTELLRNCSRVLDGTLGGGGHAVALLEAGVQSVVGVDRDPEALAAAALRLHDYAVAGRFSAVESNYASIGELPALENATFDGILLDLGISSHQVDDEQRGFTFRPGARLDMRMGRDARTDAADLLNSEDEATLTTIFKAYGDEPKGARLAREIVRRRGNQLFATVALLIATIIIRQRLELTSLWLPVLLIPQLLFALGAAWLIASLGVFLRDITQGIMLLLMAWMYLTPIIYPESIVPARFRTFINLNPFTSLIRSYRRIFLDGSAPDWRGLGYFTMFAVIIFLFGFWWFARTRKSFADVV